MDSKTIELIPDKLQENNIYINMVAEDIANDNSVEVEPYKQQIHDVVQQFYNGEVDKFTALRKIHNTLVYYDYFVVVPREKRQQQGRKKLYIDNPYDITELAIKNNVHEHDIFERGLFHLIETIGIENLQITDNNGELINDISQLKGGNQRKKAEKTIQQYCDYKRRPDIKRYALEITNVFDEPIITIFIGQGQAQSGFYLNRLIPMMIEAIATKKENEIITTTFSQLAEMIKLVNHKYNVYLNLDHKPDSAELIKKAQQHNELITYYQLRQFYKNSHKELKKIVLNILYKLDRSYSAIRFKENHLIVAKDENDNIYSFTSHDRHEDMLRYAQAAVLKEMNVSTIGGVFLQRKAPQFFRRVIKYINKEYGENWIHYRSQIEIKIISKTQLQKCYDEYIAKNSDMQISLQECRERLKKRLLHMIDSDIERAEKKYSEISNTVKKRIEQGYDNSKDIKELVECGVLTDEYRKKYIDTETNREIRRQDPWQYQPNYRDIQAEIVKFLIDSTEDK